MSVTAVRMGRLYKLVQSKKIKMFTKIDGVKHYLPYNLDFQSIAYVS